MTQRLANSTRRDATENITAAESQGPKAAGCPPTLPSGRCIPPAAEEWKEVPARRLTLRFRC